jgi:signal recognition particle subunit SRP54
MTPKERQNPAMINSSRKRRIAAGSGTQRWKTSPPFKQFEQMQKMMKQNGRHGRHAKGKNPFPQFRMPF